MVFRSNITKNCRVTIPVNIREKLCNVYGVEDLYGFEYSIGFCEGGLVFSPFCISPGRVKSIVDTRGSVGIPKPILKYLGWGSDDMMSCIIENKGTIKLTKMQ